VTSTSSIQRLDRADWQARATRHAARVDAYLEPHLARRHAGEKHPVHDFLFTYYSQRPARLRRWHPGFGVALADAEEYAGREGYARSSVGPVETTAVSPDYVASQRPLLLATEALLDATASRPTHLGCFGLHEWAMVYRLSEQGTRHPDRPLRLGPDGTDQVVESHRIACSHFDAVRFFTPTALPLNTLEPRSDDRPAYEQPACLHANMDLYKHAFRLTPMVPSELVADCFELAREIRVVDMRASPYDLTDLGLEPIAIETPDGKRAYAAAQRGFADRAAPLRVRLLEQCRGLLLSGMEASSPNRPKSPRVAIRRDNGG